MNDGRFFGQFTYLLIRIPNVRCLVAANGLMSWISVTKIKFQFKICMFSKVTELKKLIKDFLSKG